MSTAQWPERWRCLLGKGGLGVHDTILFNGENIGVGPQNLDLGHREKTSKAIDDVPLVGDRRGTARLTTGVDVGLTASILLEGDNISSGNRLLSLMHLDEGRRCRESRENAESEDDEDLWEHADGVW